MLLRRMALLAHSSLSPRHNSIINVLRDQFSLANRSQYFEVGIIRYSPQALLTREYSSSFRKGMSWRQIRVSPCSYLQGEGKPQCRMRRSYFFRRCLEWNIFQHCRGLWITSKCLVVWMSLLLLLRQNILLFYGFAVIAGAIAVIGAVIDVIGAVIGALIDADILSSCLASFLPQSPPVKL